MANNCHVRVYCPCGGRARFEEISVEAILFRCTICKSLLILPFEEESDESEDEEQGDLFPNPTEEW